MPQRRFWNFLNDDDTADFNRWLTGVLLPGVYNGYDFNPTANRNLNLIHTVTGFTDTDKAGAVVTNQSLAITKQGFVIKEDTAITINGIAAGDPTNPRIDIVVMTHAYTEIGGGAQALYSIIQGTPGASPVAPALATPATQIRIGQLYVPANMSVLNGVGVVWTRDTAGVNPAITQAITTALLAKQDTIDAGHRLNANLIGTGAVDNTEYSYLDGVSSSIQTQLNGKQATITGAASSITSSNLTANRALASDGSGKVVISATLDSELAFLVGVSSNVQTQLNGKQAPITGAASSITSSNLTANRAVASDGSGKIVVSAVLDSELAFLVGLSSNAQSQFNALIANGTWTNLTLAAGVTAGANAPQYRITPTGRIEFRGFCTGSQGVGSASNIVILIPIQTTLETAIASAITASYRTTKAIYIATTVYFSTGSIGTPCPGRISLNTVLNSMTFDVGEAVGSGFPIGTYNWEIDFDGVSCQL